MAVSKAVTVLGATGSIGASTLDVISQHPEKFSVYAVTANANVDAMVDICLRHHPQIAVMSDVTAAELLAGRLAGSDIPTVVKGGIEALADVAADTNVDIVMAAIVGAAGLEPSLAAAKAGKRVLLANKEALVTAGHLFMSEVEAAGAELLPIDSEHNAIFQCLPAGYRCGANPAGIKRILLTASGGPFRTWSSDELVSVTPEQACAHPNWSMGQKISVDSATLMNKGLELIEACWLFQVSPASIEVHVHPESIVHSMVEYLDGSILAQMGSPDMRTPIAYGLAWPERITANVSPLDLFAVGRLNFEAPDLDRFPCLRLASEAFEAGGTACAMLNAANEIAVDAFLNRRIAFTRIPQLIERTLTALDVVAIGDLSDVISADRRAREYVRGLVAE